MESVIDFNALAQVIDTTWGRSSTPNAASFSVKMTLAGKNVMAVTYSAIVSFASDRQMTEMKKRHREEAESVIKASVKHVKDSYKELTGDSLKLKQLSDPDDTLEIVNMNIHNARRSAYFRRRVTFEVS